MCDPISASTLAMASLGMSAVGTGVGIYGAIAQGEAAKASADYNAKIQRNNSIAAGYQAADAERRGEIQRDQIRLREAAVEGAGKAGWGASGVALGAGGSPETWMVDSAQKSSYDLAMSRHNTDMEVWGYKNQASNYLAQAKLDDYQGQTALTSSYINAAGTGLHGFGDIGFKTFGYASRQNPLGGRVDRNGGEYEP